jgi:transportin-1
VKQPSFLHSYPQTSEALKPSTDCRGNDDEDNNDDDDEIGSWNLRRCSAAGLDVLSNVFGDELLPIILPIVQQRLQVGCVPPPCISVPADCGYPSHFAHTRHSYTYRWTQGADWRARESAILALGAISQGCAGGLQPNLPGMVHMLLPTLMDPRPLVRCISCWALTRYTKWILDRAKTGAPQELDAVVKVGETPVLDLKRFIFFFLIIG